MVQSACTISVNCETIDECMYLQVAAAEKEAQQCIYNQFAINPEA